MKDKISKFISVLKRDGLIKTLQKTWKYIIANYYNKINISKRIYYKFHKNDILSSVDKCLNGKYERIIVWRSSFGWNVPLFQRPQQIAKCLSDKKCLVLYEVTRMTDKTKFFEKVKDNLYLINYEIKSFEKNLFNKLITISKPKYLQLYSTCWNVKKEVLDLYINNGFKLLYEYIDDLNPVLAGTNKLPLNVASIHEFVINNINNALVVTSADNLYNDMLEKRKSSKNIILSSNGVDINHFQKRSDKIISKMEDIKSNYDLIVGYYGALASWFDYELVRNLALKNKNIAFVLLGIKYDTSYDEANLNLDNIYYLGPINYNDLPNYARYFDIAWIPFIINEITLATNPCKLFEYMALEKLIITSPMPECKKYKSVFIANDASEYNKIFKNYQKLMTKEYKNILLKEANENSWDSKSNDIIKLLESSEN